MVKNDNKILSFYDWFLIVGVIASNVIYSMMTDTLDVLGSLASITGVLCVVLVAKGSIWNYAFGLVNVSLYALISYRASLYGDAGLNAFYYLPMQFIGWWQWRKCGAAVTEAETEGRGVQVKARRFTWTQRGLLAAGCAVAVIACAYLLEIQMTHMMTLMTFVMIQRHHCSMKANAIRAWATILNTVVAESFNG